MTAMTDDFCSSEIYAEPRPTRADRSAPPALSSLLGGSEANLAWVVTAFVLGATALETLARPDAAGRVRPRAFRPRTVGPALTHGENRVLYYLPTNLSAGEIAAELHLSVNTVKTHQRHLYQKLGARSRSQAVEQARALGLLAPSARRRNAAFR